MSTVGLVAAQLAIIVSGSAPAGAAPGNGAAFDCYGNTIYTVQQGGGNGGAANSTVYALDTTTLGNSTVSATAVTTMPSTANANAFGIAKGGGEAAVVAQTSTNASTVALHTYDAISGAWTTHTGTASAANENFVAGAIDPSRNIYYYASYSGTAAKATVYGYNLETNTPIAGKIATVTLPVTTTTTTGINGDMAFDLGGNLYLVESVTTDQKAGVSVVKGQLPTTGANTAIASTVLQTYSLDSQQGWNGIAFDNFGRLYIEYTASGATQLQRLNPNTGAVLGGPTKQGLTGAALAVDLAACSLNPTLSVKSDITGRSLSDDQFTMSIAGGSITQGNTATTSGTTNGVQTDYAGPVIGVSGTTYTISQTSTTNRGANYTVTFECLDAAHNNDVVAAGTGTSFDLLMPDPATGATGPYVTCTFTDTTTPAALTTTKTLTQVNGAAADATTRVKSGDKLTYAITTVNTGGRSGSTTLTDTVPANTTYSGSGEGWSCTGAACTQGVAVGPNGASTATVTKTFTVTVGTLPANTTTISNVAQSSNASCTGCTATNQTAPVLDTTLQVVEINGSPATSSTIVADGDVVLYRTTTTNTGGTAGTTTLSNPVPSRTTKAADGPGWSCAAGSAPGTACTQTINVGPGGTVTEDYLVTVTSTTGIASVTDTVSASAGTCSACTVSNPTAAQLATTLAVSKVNGADATNSTPVGPGDVVTYTVAVTNAGGSAGSTTVTNQVAANTTYTGPAGEGWTCPPGTQAGALCMQTVAVGASSSVARTYTATVVDPLPSGTKTIGDAITSDTGSCTACSVTNPTAAILATSVTLVQVSSGTAGPTTTVKAGDRLLYRVTTANTGGTAGTTTLTQTVPANTTYSGIGAQGWSCAAGSPAGTVCTHPSSIDSGATISYFFQVTVDKPVAPDATTIVDTVTTSTGTCSACSVSNAVVPTLDTVVVIDTVNGQPATASTALAEGDQVAYRIRVTDADGPDGSVTITNVVPANTTFTGTDWSCPTGSAAGTTCTKTVTVARGTPTDVPFPVRVGTLPAGVTTIDEAASVSTGSCSSCAVSNPTVAKLDTTATIVTVNGNAATVNTALKAGDVVVYRVSTANTGGATGTTTLTDVVPANSTYTGSGEGWNCNAGNTSCTQVVSIGSAVTVATTVTVTIGTSPTGTTTLTDTVSSTASTCSSCTVTNPTVAALSTTVAIVSVNGEPATSTTQLRPGDVVVYAVTVSNSGGVNGSTTVADEVPANTTYTGTGEGWSCATGADAGSACTRAVTVASGGDTTLAYTVRVDEPLPANTTSVDNTVTTTNGACANCSASNPTVAVVATTLVLATVNGAAAGAATAIAPGDVLGYRVIVTNTGGSSATVTVSETVPDQTEYTGAGWSCSGRTCTRTVVAGLGTSTGLDFEVTADAPFVLGTKKIDNAVTTNVGACTACSVSNPTAAQLDTVLTLVTVNGKPYVAGTPVAPGDILGYRATVTNTGGTSGTTTLTDRVPANTTYTGTGENWTCAAGTCTQDVTVPSGTNRSVDFTVTVVDPLPKNTTAISNTATSSAGGCATCTVDTATTGRLDTVLTLAEVNGAAADTSTQIAPGATLHYTVTLANTGGTAVTTTLTQPVPAHTSYVGVGEGWTCAGGTCTRTITVAPASTTVLDFTVTAADPMPSDVTTIADTVMTSAGTCSACSVANPTVAKLDTTLVIALVDGKPYDNSPLRPGDVVSYRMTVTNTGGSTGTTTLEQTVPTNTTYTGTGWTCTGTACTRTVTAAAGSSATTTFAVTVADPIPAGTQTIGDGVTSSSGTCSSCSVSAPVVGALDTVLTVVTVNGKEASTATQVTSGDEIGYRMTVTNTGGASATTKLTQTVPAHTHYSGTDWDCSGTTCTREVTVGKNASAQVTFTVTVDDLPSGTTTVDDTVTSSTGTCSSCSVANPTVGTLSVSKRVTAVNGGPVAPVAPGDVVTYTITAVNSGGSAATTTLTDTVPATARYTGTGEGWACTGATCTQSVSVDPSAQQELAFTMTVADTLPDGTGTVANTVASSAGSCTACTATSATVAALRTSKTLATVNGRPAAGVHVRAGDVLGYQLRVDNVGGTEGTTMLSERVPAHTGYTGRGEGWTCRDTMCSRDVTVAALRSTTVRFTVTVAALDDTTDPAIVNTVASTAGLCPSCEVRTPIARADLTVLKTADRSAVAVGDTVSFTVRVSNAGPDEAREVTVVDTPTGLRLQKATTGDGSFADGRWQVGALVSGGSAVLRTTYVVTAAGASNVASVGSRNEVDPTSDRNAATVGLADSQETRRDAPTATANTGVDIGTALRWALLLLTAGLGFLWVTRERKRIPGRHRV